MPTTNNFIPFIYSPTRRSSSSSNGGIKNRRHLSEAPKNVFKPIIASSQLVVEVSELHADSNGRLEITCLATIPAHVGPGEQFADYKTYSVKSEFQINRSFRVLVAIYFPSPSHPPFLPLVPTVDVEQKEVTTGAPQPRAGRVEQENVSSSGRQQRGKMLRGSGVHSWMPFLVGVLFLCGI